ncbi:hypothetical protein F4801DRAFT_481453 [Xylaria longipes]|nr:hypothetical protein F4801DRAFT_481453 [Xylaria longipes]
MSLLRGNNRARRKLILVILVSILVLSMYMRRLGKGIASSRDTDGAGAGAVVFQWVGAHSAIKQVFPFWVAIANTSLRALPTTYTKYLVV